MSELVFRPGQAGTRAQSGPAEARSACRSSGPDQSACMHRGPSRSILRIGSGVEGATGIRCRRSSMVCRYGLSIAVALALATVTARAEVSELKISKQPGLLFAPMLLMEHHKLVEKHAKDAGVPDLKAAWLTLMSGGANNDALLSGNLHIVTSGVTNMLLLWGKTNGD